MSLRIHPGFHYGTRKRLLAVTGLSMLRPVLRFLGFGTSQRSGKGGRMSTLREGRR